MVIARFKPGEIPFSQGKYILVGHYGERTERTASRAKGEVLPSGLHSLNDSKIEEPLWYVSLDDLSSKLEAA